jgi:hypothetical protein
MSKIQLLNLAICTTEVMNALRIRDQLKELNLFERLSFDVGRMMYFIYIKPVGTDNYDGLATLVETNKYRLVKYHY